MRGCSCSSGYRGPSIMKKWETLQIVLSTAAPIQTYVCLKQYRLMRLKNRLIFFVRISDFLNKHSVHHICTQCQDHTNSLWRTKVSCGPTMLGTFQVNKVKFHVKIESHFVILSAFWTNISTFLAAAQSLPLQPVPIHPKCFFDPLQKISTLNFLQVD